MAEGIEASDIAASVIASQLESNASLSARIAELFDVPPEFLDRAATHRRTSIERLRKPRSTTGESHIVAVPPPTGSSSVAETIRSLRSKSTDQ